MQAEIYEYFLKNQKDILVSKDDKEAAQFADAATLAGKEVYVLPDFRAVYGDDLRSYYDELLNISKELNKFYKSKSKNKLIISPVKTLLHKLPGKKHLQSKTINFADKLNLSEFKDEIVRFGYEVVDIVELSGEVSFRGEIIDIFPVGSESAFRILLDDNEVESIRSFDVTTQLSEKIELESLEIVPFIASLNKEEFEKASQKIQNLQSDALISDLNSLGFWAVDDFVDYLSEFSAVSLYKFDDEEFKESFEYLKNMEILPQATKFKDLSATFSNEFLAFHKNKKIKILARNSSIFASLNIEKTPNLEFVLSPLILNLISRDEVIISLNKPLSKKRHKKSSIVIDELKVGDYVVHSEYGIGKFIGLELARVMGAQREFVAIAYQNNDKLLLPVENLNMIDRYIANAEVAALDRLGKGSFAKIKEKVREKLFAIASRIIEMAAQRELVEGKSLASNSNEYAKFISHAGFEYTKDQARSIEDIQNELKSGKVMDRLLSGDVGFGKTEVAMNAIFTAVKSGYQALFFVPTTLLSSQHYKSLKERFREFEIPVFRLDRFSTTAGKNALKKALFDGTPLVCVGTHALLGLEAKNIGLIVIDEEHKFGVKQKEKLKEISSNSHVLSMSATPIPRSLNMALSSIKTYSTLLTPPKDRQDVKTLVKEWDEKVVKEAILRELRRGGQIFYVHNHIASMQGVEKELLQILPNLRILTLHSKIDQKITEEEVMKFLNKEYDLLLCTSIVESGIHMPNVNTIIVNSANKFGIADLHQLRGRVGRSDRQAYCYFLIEDKNALNKDSLKRLVALESNSFLGSGSVLAYHDLEIRGGGNLVGEAQSGHIEAIGYSLYLRMLEDEINALLNKKANVINNVDMRLNVTAFLNSDYIKEDRLRLELYRRLSKCKDAPSVYEVASEMEDRFGKFDIYTKQFVDVMLIKVMAQNLGIKAISNYEMNISLTKQNNEKIVLKSRSKDDDDILAEILAYLRKESK
ncbi:DEAD/DEAH box helicase [Campylobacter geochelonis]|uniref:DEAD/DEAH box helicase n=1 Tax=Campylobacter geochelonis TaxID=1780362 RepID=UPI000770B3A8|nr:DEAD/DEAH box helicase [Campylobacter geochelonis]CZE50197.1 transcription-repair coupling factor [Campylobacter geochelonis]